MVHKHWVTSFTSALAFLNEGNPSKRSNPNARHFNYNYRGLVLEKTSESEITIRHKGRGYTDPVLTYRANGDIVIPLSSFHYAGMEWESFVSFDRPKEWKARGGEGFVIGDGPLKKVKHVEVEEIPYQPPYFEECTRCTIVQDPFTYGTTEYTYSRQTPDAGCYRCGGTGKVKADPIFRKIWKTVFREEQSKLYLYPAFKAKSITIRNGKMIDLVTNEQREAQKKEHQEDEQIRNHMNVLVELTRRRAAREEILSGNPRVTRAYKTFRKYHNVITGRMEYTGPSQTHFVYEPKYMPQADGSPGEMLPIVGGAVVCHNGYHGFLDDNGYRQWASGKDRESYSVFRVELYGPTAHQYDKLAALSGRVISEVEEYTGEGSSWDYTTNNYTTFINQWEEKTPWVSLNS